MSNKIDILKVGDKVVCHSLCKMSTGENALTVGKTYTITGIKEDDCFDFCIEDDQESPHWFSFDEKKYLYTKWFSSVKEVRKKKLKKIQNGISL